MGLTLHACLLVNSESKWKNTYLKYLKNLLGVDMIGIFSVNNYEYDIAIMGGYCINLANVSLYDTLGEEAVEHINNQAELKVVFVQNVDKMNLLLRINTPDLKTIVVMEN